MKRVVPAGLAAMALLASCNALLDNQLGQSPTGDAGTELPGDASSRDGESSLDAEGPRKDSSALPADAAAADARPEAGVELIVTNAPLESLQDLASDGANVFWSTVDNCGGNVTHVTYRAAWLDGTAVRTLTTRATSGVACGYGFCYQMALSSTGVVFTNGADQGAGAVQTVGKDGGAVASLADNEDTPCAVATLQGKPYWSSGLARLRALDGNGVARTVLDSVQVQHIVADGTSLYMTAMSYMAERAALRADVTGDGGLAITPLFKAINGRIGGIALSPTHVFWADSASGRILMESKSGGTPVVVVSGSGIPSEVAFRDGYLYFTASASVGSRGDGLVGKVQIVGDGPSGAVLPIATGQDLPGQIAVDDTYVYRADALSKIYRAPR